MPLDTFVLVAAQYDNVDDALADYRTVHAIYTDLDIIDTYDAAVISKNADGKVSIVKKHEQPTRDGTVKGLYVGLAVGALVAVFPAVLLGAGMLVGSAAGAGVGARAGSGSSSTLSNSIVSCSTVPPTTSRPGPTTSRPPGPSRAW